MIIFVRLIVRRCFSSSLGDLGVKIKQLNERKQFQKAIDLFYANQNQPNISALAVNQTLKAFIELKEFNRAIELHQRLPSTSLNNYYIRNSLIRLYSELF